MEDLKVGDYLIHKNSTNVAYKVLGIPNSNDVTLLSLTTGKAFTRPRTVVELLLNIVGPEDLI